MEEALFCGLQGNESTTPSRWKGYISRPKPYHDHGPNDPAQHGSRTIHMRQPTGHTRLSDCGQPHRRQRYDSSSSAAAWCLSGDGFQSGTTVGSGVEDVLAERSSPSKSHPSRPRFSHCLPSSDGGPVQINPSSPPFIVSTSAWEKGPTSRSESYHDADWKNQSPIGSSSDDYFRSVAHTVQSTSVPRGGVRASTAAVLQVTTPTKEEASSRTLASIETSQASMFSRPSDLGSSDEYLLCNARTHTKCLHSSTDDYELHYRVAASDPVQPIDEALSDGKRENLVNRDVPAPAEFRDARKNLVQSLPASTLSDPILQTSDVQVLAILYNGIDALDNSRTDAGSDLHRKPFQKTSNSYPSLTDFFQSRKKHQSKHPKDLNLSFLQSNLDGNVSDYLSAPQTDAVSSTRLVLTSASNTPDSDCLDAGSLTSSEAGSVQASSCSHSCVSPRDTQPHSSCGSCWGSAVPPVTLPRPPPVSDYCCCPSPCPDTEPCRRIEEGSRYPLAAALVDACVSLLETPCCSQPGGAGSDSAKIVSDVTITEPIMHLVSSLLVPSLEALLLRGITDYSSNASIAGYLRAARLTLMETPLIIPDVTDSQPLLDSTIKWSTAYEYSGKGRRGSRTSEPPEDKHVAREVAECVATSQEPIASQTVESSGFKVLPVVMSKSSASASKVLSSVSNTVTNSFNSICIATRAHMREATTAVSTLQPFGIRKSPTEGSQSVTVGVTSKSLPSVVEPLSEPIAPPSTGNRLRASALFVHSDKEDPTPVKICVAASSHSCQVVSGTGGCLSTTSAMMSSVCDAAVATVRIPTDLVKSSRHLKWAKEALSREAVERQIKEASADITTGCKSIDEFETGMSASADHCSTTHPSSSGKNESRATDTAFFRPCSAATRPCDSGKEEDQDETSEFKRILLNSLPAGLLWTGLGDVLVHQLLTFLEHPHYSRQLAMHLLHLFCSHLLPHHR